MDSVKTKKSKARHGFRKPPYKNSSNSATTVSECVLIRCARQIHHTNAAIIHSQPSIPENSSVVNMSRLDNRLTPECMDKISLETSHNVATTTVISTCFLPQKTMGKPLDSIEIPQNGMMMTIYVKPLIVLDLNGILCRRVRGDHRDNNLEKETSFGQDEVKNDYDAFPTTQPSRSDRIKPMDANRRPTYRPSCAFIAGTPIISRTDLHPLLLFLDSHFTLAVWTSAKQKTAKLLVKALFPTEIANRLLFIWGQNYCERMNNVEVNTESLDSEELPKTDAIETRNQQAGQVEDVSTVSSNHNSKDTIFIKSLAKVWNQFPLWNATNTLLVDDSPDKCPKIHLKNTIHPPPISGLDSSVLDNKLQSTLPSHEIRFNLLTDEVNQERQRIFFEKLINIWAEQEQPTLPLCQSKLGKDEKLYRFLHEYGRGHMGWRG